MKGLRICRIFGIDIELHWSLLIIVALISASLFYFFAVTLKASSPEIHLCFAILAAILLFASILFHELAHSLVGQKFGVEIKRIILLIYGGVAQFEGETMFDQPKAEFLMAIAGPIFSFFLSGLFAILHLLANHFSPIFAPLFYYLGFINFVLAALNLFPLFPLDGGRILRSILWWREKDLLKSTEMVVAMKNQFGILLAVLVYVLFGWANFLWIAILLIVFILPAADGEYLGIFIREKTKGMKVNDILGKTGELAYTCSPDDNLQEVLKIMYESQAGTFIVKKEEQIIDAISFRKILEYLKNK